MRKFLLQKIDSELLSTLILTNEKTDLDCFVFVNDFNSAKSYFEKEKIKVTAEFSFIKLFSLEVDKNVISKLCEERNITYISKHTSVTSLMFLSKKILQINSKFQGENITICYIDTGIAPHFDFVLNKNRIIKFIDLINGKKQPYDDNGHGTFISGVGSGSGILSNRKYSGIAPKSNIISIKALNKDGEASALKILEAMQWIFENHKKYNIKVVCMSFGSEPLGFNDPIMKGAEELWRSGVVMVAAAGNSGPEYESIRSPGISPKIITVGGLNDNRIDNENYNKNFFEIASFSSRGPALRKYKPDLVAPAVNIISCSNNGKEFYKSLSGTSVATPMIAGLSALICEKEPYIKPDNLKQKLLSVCSSITYNRNVEGYGLPNISKLLR